MYVEERMYTLKTGSVPEYLKHYQNDGMKVQLKHLPHMVGYMWAYESLDQRDTCRAAMSADPRWQETRVMKCAPFFVDRLKKMLAAAQ
jgi:uncharacterized protein YbaA (DUF1428 family)